MNADTASPHLSNKQLHERAVLLLVASALSILVISLVSASLAVYAAGGSLTLPAEGDIGKFLKGLVLHPNNPAHMWSTGKFPTPTYWLVFMALAGLCVALPIYALTTRGSRRRPQYPGYASPYKLWESVRDVNHGWPLGRSLRPEGLEVSIDIQTGAMFRGAPGMGKSTLATNVARTWEGPMAITDVSGSLFALTVRARQKLGPIFKVDPDGLLPDWVPSLSWDVVDGCEDLEVARRRTTQLMADASGSDDSGNGRFFRLSAASWITGALHAAALDHRPFSDVLAWCDDYKNNQTAAMILREAFDETNGSGSVSTVGLVSGTAGGDSAVTSDSIMKTVLSHLNHYRTPAAIRTLCPDSPSPSWDALAELRATVYYIGKERGSSAGKLTSLLLEEQLDATSVAAERRGTPWNPGFLALLDEIANVGRVHSLPELATTVRKTGVTIVAFFHTYAQAVGIWGIDRAATLRGALKLQGMFGSVGSPQEQTEFANSCGRRIVGRTSTSEGGSGSSMTTSEHDVPVVTEAELQSLAAHQVMCLLPGVAGPVLVDVPRWWESNEAEQINKEIQGVNHA